ncbi:putative zinc-type alcohol dehydrogenase-like protein [Rhizodiscina lignyota]|uniref:Zinc-type alcohol dehydrogenase-like protein n=1 Tax=Rhizodiscina lignyota TaxID=1504668 RepID=A0A9P4I3N0_9PEZI|nr:putative zinc-type alcohol dehydrogenase-like protein [Rhizodiscina lignyota]
MRAAALNARDFMVIAHDPIYPGEHVQDLVPCADGAGEIEKVGEESKWKVGDNVIIHPNAWMEDTGEVLLVSEIKTAGAASDQGTLRQYAIWEDEKLVRAPAHLTFEELAALPACGSTAMNALFYGPQELKPGMTVLSQGTGGVSCFAIQLASAAGATVIATSSSDAKLAQARGIGATHLINYNSHPNWEEEVLRLTNGRGVDNVIEIGGAATVEQSVKCTKQGGLVSLVGFLSDSKKSDLVPALIFGAKTVRGVFNWSKPMIEAMAEFVEKHKIHPVVAEAFEWEDAKAAFEMLNKQSAVGKIVIKI